MKIKINIKFNVPMKYKELCASMNDKEQTGRSRVLQVKRWEKDYEIKKNGTLYTVIRELSDEEKLITYNSGKYQKHIEDFLICYLSKEALNNKNSCVLTNRNILEMSTMINLDYFKAKNYFQKYANEFDININEKDMPKQEYKMQAIFDEQYIFFSASYRLLKRLIENALKTFEQSSLILKNKTFVCYKNYKIGNNIYNEMYKCDDDMIQRILTVQNKAIKEFNSLMDEKYNDGRYHLKDINIKWFLKDEDAKQLKSIVKELFHAEFKDEGFTAYSSAWDIKLADGICFKDELESRNFDWKLLNNNVINKLSKAKDLNGLKLNNQFIRRFIKCVSVNESQIAIEYNKKK